jgi:hypothetical protein
LTGTRPPLLLEPLELPPELEELAPSVPASVDTAVVPPQAQVARTTAPTPSASAIGRIASPSPIPIIPWHPRTVNALSLEADYLVVGCGAMGMAFADAIVAETNATLVMVDRHHAPGGHWNDAYPFVRLHQPATYYGVNSLPLGTGAKDTAGLNCGHAELASGAEVCGYFDRVMQHRFLASGRVQYFPLSDYRGDGRFVSLASGNEYAVRVRKKIVDATYTNTEIPSARKPPFTVAPGMRLIPVNGLARLLVSQRSTYVIIGAGKTAMDACLWLLQRGVEPGDIRWIRPRDAWLLDRANVEPDDGLGASLKCVALQMEAAAKAETKSELFDRLAACGALLRIDDDVRPTAYRCATVSQAELAELRRIRNVVRMGHVRAIERDRILLDRGEVPTDRDCIHVDCAANGLQKRETRPVFGADTITLQNVRTCQPTFSAALIGHVEAAYEDVAEKNVLCAANPYPVGEADWMRMSIANTMLHVAWAQKPDLMAWLDQSRLNVIRGMVRALQCENAELMQTVLQLRANTAPAMEKLQRLLAAERDAAE